MAAASLCTGILSPVSADSSAVREVLSISLASAGNLFPVSTLRMSPTATSRCGMSSAPPSLITRTWVSSASRFSASKALALRPSIATVIIMESDIAAKIPAHSIKSVSPPLMPRAIFTPSVISAAAVSMSIIGSRAASASRRSIEAGFFFVKLFSP